MRPFLLRMFPALWKRCVSSQERPQEPWGSHFEPLLVQTSYSFMESLFDVDQQTYR